MRALGGVPAIGVERELARALEHPGLIPVDEDRSHRLPFEAVHPDLDRHVEERRQDVDPTAALREVALDAARLFELLRQIDIDHRVRLGGTGGGADADHMPRGGQEPGGAGPEDGVLHPGERGAEMPRAQDGEDAGLRVVGDELLGGHAEDELDVLGKRGEGLERHPGVGQHQDLVGAPLAREVDAGVERRHAGHGAAEVAGIRPPLEPARRVQARALGLGARPSGAMRVAMNWAIGSAHVASITEGSAAENCSPQRSAGRRCILPAR